MGLSRRGFLGVATATFAASSLSELGASQQPTTAIASSDNQVDLSQLHASTETPEKTPGPFSKPSERIGFAVVGLGHLSLNQILPSFGKTKYAKPVALVSGDRLKALKIANQYGIQQSAVYDYQTYENIAHNPDVKIIYIVLPNSMHAEYVLRGAKLGKHILCEKPMATSAKDCEAMIAACETARVKLMIAYRQQYEPMNRAIVKMVQSGKLGALKSIIATNGQNQGKPAIEAVDQFAQEIDHMSLCVMTNRRPHTPGEEGLQDQKLLEAIYASAKVGHAVRVPNPTKLTRGPELEAM